MPFTSVQPPGASLGRFRFEAGRLRPLFPKLSYLPVASDARLGRDTWTSQGLRHIVYIIHYTSSPPTVALSGHTATG